MTELTAYPLAWPDGWPRRNPVIQREARFSRYGQALSIADGCQRVLDELERLGVPDRDIIVSTNVKLRLDGLPRSDSAEPRDPGAAVYWQWKRKRQCMAIDLYDRVADNLAAIAATLEALRAIDRHGGGQILDRAFTGFVALPAPEQPWQVLGVAMNASRLEIEDAHRRLAMKHHPDRGGSDDQMKRINAARDALLARR